MSQWAWARHKSLNANIFLPPSAAALRSNPPKIGTPITERAKTIVKNNTIIDYLFDLAM